MSRPNGFDVMKTMSAKNRDIRLAPVSNVVRVQKTKHGTQVTIGLEGDDVIGGIAQGRFLGGLILADKDDWRKTEAEILEGGRSGAAAPAHAEGSPVASGNNSTTAQGTGSEIGAPGCVPWWDALDEYPSPLDVKRLRQDAMQLLVAAKMALEALPIALRTALRPEDLPNNANVEALRAAIAKAEGRQ